MMTKREVVGMVMDGKKPPYVPWHFSFTEEPRRMLCGHFGTDDLDMAVGNHFLTLGNAIGFFEELENDRYRDAFGVIWDRSVDKDIGVVENCLLPEPDLTQLRLPNPRAPRSFEDMEPKISANPDRYRIFCIGFSLYERAWSMRGMET